MLIAKKSVAWIGIHEMSALISLFQLTIHRAHTVSFPSFSRMAFLCQCRLFSIWHTMAFPQMIRGFAIEGSALAEFPIRRGTRSSSRQVKRREWEEDFSG